ncbi:MAG TPA: hypothetical protein VGI70_04900, partial [Polyangiales bacterium]
MTAFDAREKLSGDAQGSVRDGGVSGSTLMPAPGRAKVEQAITAARSWLLARQHAPGHWCEELEGDTTLESYMILLEAFLGRRGSPKSSALARVIREEMLPAG